MCGATLCQMWRPSRASCAAVTAKIAPDRRQTASASRTDTTATRTRPGCPTAAHRRPHQHASTQSLRLTPRRVSGILLLALNCMGARRRFSTALHSLAPVAPIGQNIHYATLTSCSSRPHLAEHYTWYASVLASPVESRHDLEKVTHRPPFAVPPHPVPQIGRMASFPPSLSSAVPRGLGVGITSFTFSR